MSDLLQAGHHPDADQLNAFVERTLPAHEHERTLAHLAICPACRQIVALSLPPEDESPSARAEAVRKQWFSGWHLAWAGVPVLAAAILCIVYFRNSAGTARQTTAPAQMADARPPVSRVAPARPPASAASGTSIEQQAAIPFKRSKAAPMAQQLDQKQIVANTKRPSQQQSESLREPARGAASGTIGGLLGGVASQPPQLQANAVTAPSPVLPDMLAANRQNKSVPASPVAIGGPVANVPRAAPLTKAVAANVLVADRAPSLLFTRNPLPSHLAVLSMAANAHQLLAIDTQNNVFFSNDDGIHWKAVLSRWKGRAVNVALASSLSQYNNAATLKVSSHPTATPGPVLFGTVTDQSGAVIPGATVVVKNSTAAAVARATTDSSGRFRIENLAPGSCRVEAKASGFQPQSFAIELAASKQTVADLILQVGSVSQAVMVQASPSSIATEPPTVPESIDAKKTTALPVSPTLSHFEITTDTGDRWTSTDGQTWKHE